MLGHLTSHGLLAKLDDLIALERRTIVDELLCLAEIERRRIHLELSSSMFLFCTDRLKWPKGTAWRRTTAAEMVAKRPVIAEYLRDGRLSTATLVLLKDVIEKDASVLDRAAGKNVDQVKELVAAMQPRDRVADLFTRVDHGDRGAVANGNGTASAFGPTAESTTAINGAGSKVELNGGGNGDVGSRVEMDRGYAGVGSKMELQRAVIEPVSSELRRMHVTVGKEFMDDLAKVKSLLSHKIVDGNLEKVLHECIKKTIEVCEKRKKGSDKPRATKTATTRTTTGTTTTATATGKTGARRRRIATAVMREVWNRDEGKCQFAHADGTKCGSTHQVEFDHRVPDGKGGPPTAANIRLLCRAHNQHEAEKAYGRVVMDRWRRAKRRV